MERWFQQFAGAVALSLEILSVVLIIWGAAHSLFTLVTAHTRESGSVLPSPSGRRAFLMLGRYLLLGLEFTLAADVVHTAIAPSWDDIGKLGSIALIRTFLNFFLERDIQRARAEVERALPAAGS